MNISEWSEQPFAKDLVIEGLECLKATCIEFFKRSIEQQSVQQNTNTLEKKNYFEQSPC